jgi:hypothetical protein
MAQKNTINWNVLTWHHICIPMNQDMSWKDVLIVTIYTYYCSQFLYLSRSQNGTLFLHNSSQSYIPHEDCDCSNTALYYAILHCPQWLTQAQLPHTLVRNDSFESKSGKRRDETSLWMCPSPWSSSTTCIHRCYAVLLCAIAAVSDFPVFPPTFSLGIAKQITTEQWVPKHSPSSKAGAWPAMGSCLSD